MGLPSGLDSTILGLREVTAALEKIQAAGGTGHGRALCDLADLLDAYKQQLLIFAVTATREAQGRGH